MPCFILAIRSSLRRLVPWIAAFGLVIASPAWGQQGTSAVRLQSLVNDAAIQLRLSYRQDPQERQLRRDELGLAIAAWNKSARNETDNQLLADWLREAMRASMPGSHEPLPALPEFQRPTPPAERAVPSVASPNSTMNTKSAVAPSPNAATEPTPVDLFPTASAAGRADHGEIGAVDDDKAHHEALPTFETIQPGAATELPPAIAGQPNVGATNSNVEKPVAAEKPSSEMEGDPFRDDPLPAGK